MPDSPANQPRPEARLAVYHSHFREDFRWWLQTDRRLASRVLDLVEAVLCDPFQGIGKAEPLKGLGPNTWSRRVND